MTNPAAEIRRIRRRLLRDLLATLRPHLRDSGYRIATSPDGDILKGSRPYQICAFGNGWTPLPGGKVVTEFFAIAEDGVVTDAYGGGCITTYWRGLVIEDIAALLRLDWSKAS